MAMNAMRLHNEGAEAKVYALKLFGIDAVAKDRIKKPYRVPELDALIRAQRTKKEASILIAANAAGVPVPKVLFVSKTVLYMEFIKGSRLSDLNSYSKYMKKAGRYLAMLHNANIVHGDYTPANLVANASNLFVIDFGLSSISNSIEDKAIDLLLMKRSVCEHDYSLFADAYVKHSANGIAILKKLSSIELRGRYMERTLLH